MPDYRQATGTANLWRRAYQVTINNPRNNPPNILFMEEDVVTVEGAEFRQPNAGMVSGSFDPSGVIELRDPATGELTGQTATQAELYAILHSLYIQLALARDAAAASPAPAPGPEPSAP